MFILGIATAYVLAFIVLVLLLLNAPYKDL
jgi:hypothetical protein